jgi:DNA-binding GntR family transcriptional regulator
MADNSRAHGGFSKRQVLADGVYEAVMSLLMDGSIQPGEAIHIDTLSRELDVSPTPIREALARIEPTGLVVRGAMRGYRSAPMITPEDMQELMAARLLIEPHNTANVCAQHDPKVLSELEESLRQMRKAPTGPSYHEYRSFLNADAAFHDIIARNSGNRFLAAAFTSLGFHFQRFRLFDGQYVSDAADGIREHQKVLDVLRKGTPEEAFNVMAWHLEHVRDRAVTGAALAASHKHVDRWTKASRTPPPADTGAQ